MLSTPMDEVELNPSFELTNDPNLIYKVMESYAYDTGVFVDLQKLERIGRVVPIREEYMYYAAMNSKACKLTSAGRHY